MATKKKKPQKGRRAPLIQVTIQRRPKRRMRLFRGLKAVVKAVIKGEPTVKYSGGVGAPAKSPKSKSVGGGGRPIRNPGWQGPDPYQGGAVWDDRWTDPRDVDLDDAQELGDYTADDIEELDDVDLANEFGDDAEDAYAYDGDAT